MGKILALTGIYLLIGLIITLVGMKTFAKDDKEDERMLGFLLGIFFWPLIVIHGICHVIKVTVMWLWRQTERALNWWVRLGRPVLREAPESIRGPINVPDPLIRQELIDAGNMLTRNAQATLERRNMISPWEEADITIRAVNEPPPPEPLSKFDQILRNEGLSP